MAISITLSSFQGPLDLLLHLIEKNEIEIWDVEISSLADQYTEYIGFNSENRPHTDLSMDSISEFIVMAATLLEIKSKMLLPKNTQEAEEAETDREELIEKLIEYKKYKDSAAMLKSRTEYALLAFYKSPEADLISMFEKAPPPVSEILGGVTLDALKFAFEDVLRRKSRKVDNIRAGFGSVTRDAFTVDEKIEHIKNLLTLFTKISFFGIFVGNSSKTEIIVTFLALLELTKRNYIMIVQTDTLGDIYISAA